MQKGRSLWPIGILIVIFLGVMLIIVSIRISKQQSIDTDHTFDLKKDIVDKDINKIMQKQNIFSNIYNVRINVTMPHNIENSIIMNSPYYATPVPKKEDNAILNNSENIIFLYLENKQNNNLDNIQFVDIQDISLEFVRLIQGEKEVTSLIVPMDKIDTNIYRARDFSLPLKGYYQARFKITANFTNESKDTKKYPVYFYQWIFNSNAK